MNDDMDNIEAKLIAFTQLITLWNKANMDAYLDVKAQNEVLTAKLARLENEIRSFKSGLPATNGHGMNAAAQGIGANGFL